ncbi:TPA: Arc family DNA-binding protein [Serratia fonticola]
MSKQYSPYPFRMPVEVREQLEEKSREAGRSLQQEMLRRIDLTLKLEAMLRSKVAGIDALYDFIFEVLIDNKRKDSQIEQLQGSLDKLNEQNRLLTQSTRINDEQRFDTIRRSILTAKDALDKAEKSLPIIPEEPKDMRPSYNPNKKPT